MLLITRPKEHFPSRASNAKMRSKKVSHWNWRFCCFFVDFSGKLFWTVFSRSTPVKENALWVALSLAIFIAPVRNRALARSFINKIWTFLRVTYRPWGLCIMHNPRSNKSELVSLVARPGVVPYGRYYNLPIETRAKEHFSAGYLNAKMRSKSLRFWCFFSSVGTFFG